MSASTPQSPSHGFSNDVALPRTGELFGHPTCLFTLFFAEMWERFSFYGMKALLILYMVNYLFWRQGEASHVMAWYAGLVYATPVLGGIIADKITGARWAVVIGGVIIAIGHFLLAFEPLPFFYSGLGCLVVGTGFLKPNISTQVGALYRSDDERRDSAFTIFYMGINLGAFLGPLVCEALRINLGYHYGFAAAGVGMVIGLIVYIAGMGSVVRREKQIAAEEAQPKTGGEHEPAEQGEQPTAPAEPATLNGVSMSRVYFDRGLVLVVICVFAILFWVGFEQAANVMNLWADQHTNLHVGSGEPVPIQVDAEAETGPEFDYSGGEAWRMGPAMTQSINPFFIITLAAVFAWLWQFLESRKMQPSTPMKMALGVFFLSGAYGIMLGSAQTENQPSQVQLAELPAGLEVDEQGHVFALTGDADTEERMDFGATRLIWQNGALEMRGVLTDLDWMRALGASAPASFQEAVAALQEQAEARAEEVRTGIRTGALASNTTWEVSVELPSDAGTPLAAAGWPMEEVDGEDVPKVTWDAATRTLTTSAVLAARDQAQVLAAGAEPSFRAALTDVFQQASLHKVSIGWLLAFYLVLTIGELCISPVGLSLVTKAAHPNYVGLFMGIWFLTTGAISNYLAHFVGGYWGAMTPTEYFMIFGVLGLAATVIMLIMLRILRPMLHGIH